MSTTTGTQAPGRGPSQTGRKAALLAGLVAGLGFLLVGDSYWPDGHWLHEALEWAGLALIFLCIAGRTWSALYIGGRKNQHLVTDGPYSICRNPLYSFSIIGAAGVGLQTGSLVAGAICGVLTWGVFNFTVRREEAALLATFGTAYRDYLAAVPRFLFRASTWHSPELVEVQPQIVLTTFFDALVFVLAVPLAESLDWLHDSQILPTLLQIP